MADMARREDLRELTEHPTGPCVSLYLPTRVPSQEAARDRIRLRHLLDDAEERLRAAGASRAVAARIVEPGRGLLTVDPARGAPGGTLVMFLAADLTRLWWLPVTVEERLRVGDHFDVTPALAAVEPGGRFYLFAFSQRQRRLFAATARDIAPVALPGAPTDLAEFLRYDDLERQRLLHVTGRGGAGAPAMFRGHGAGGEVDKVLLERYLRALDDALVRVLHGERAPLVLASVGYEQAMLRAVTRYPAVVAEGVDGNPDELAPAQLHERAWPLVASILAGG